MTYRVHQLDIKLENEQEKLEKFLNSLKGDVISIIPNVRPTFHSTGATATIDFLLLVEKLARTLGWNPQSFAVEYILPPEGGIEILLFFQAITPGRVLNVGT